MEDNLMGFVVILFCLSCTILPCILLKQLYKRKHKKKEAEFLSYLKKHQFDLKNEKHLKLIRQESIDKYFNSLKMLTSMLVFNTLALVRIRRAYSVCLFSVLLALFLYKWFKKFDDSSLKVFTCPKCHGKVCWFLKGEFESDKENFVRNQQKKETDANDNVRTISVPVNCVKYKKHTVYYCEKCHHQEETITDHARFLSDK